MKTFVIVPVYNEEFRVIRLVKKILSIVKNKIIIVDDGSTDNSLEMIKKAFDKNRRIVILSHIFNLGKGAAMKTGVKMAFKAGGEAVIFIDSDGQHKPKDLNVFNDKLKSYPLVFGYRDLNDEMPLIRKFGNEISKSIVNKLFHINRKDFLCGFWGFKKEVYKKIKWKSNRYGVETEVATKLGKNKLSFCEVKIDTIYIDKYKGVTIFDAFRILSKIPFWYFN